jgi:hypothetical protein
LSGAGNAAASPARAIVSIDLYAILDYNLERHGHEIHRNDHVPDASYILSAYSLFVTPN